MKRKRIIFIVFGWLCICMNALGWLAVVAVPNNKYAPEGIPETIGFNFWFIIGVVLLLSANKLKRQIRKNAEQEQLDSFLTDKVSSTDYIE